MLHRIFRYFSENLGIHCKSQSSQISEKVVEMWSRVSNHRSKHFPVPFRDWSRICVSLKFQVFSFVSKCLAN